MAIVIEILVKAPDVLLTVTADDVTDDIERFDLVCTVPVHITVYRKSDNPWRDAWVEAGTYTYEAGGPVRNWSDLSRIEVGW